MIMKTKKSISLSNSLLNELALINKKMNISQFVETALLFYLDDLKKQARIQRDMEIIKSNQERFNREAEENLEFQAVL